MEPRNKKGFEDEGDTENKYQKFGGGVSMSEMIDIYELKQDKLMHIGIMDKKEAEKKGKLHKVSRVYPVKNINGDW